MSAPEQITLDTPRIRAQDITSTEIGKILSKIRRSGGRILKVKVSPSAVDDKNGGHAEG